MPGRNGRPGSGTRPFGRRSSVRFFDHGQSVSINPRGREPGYGCAGTPGFRRHVRSGGWSRGGLPAPGIDRSARRWSTTAYPKKRRPRTAGSRSSHRPEPEAQNASQCHAVFLQTARDQFVMPAESPQRVRRGTANETPGSGCQPVTVDRPGVPSVSSTAGGWRPMESALF